jgi:prepilin-type N-terminal cleavage/methylation domain-containing protein
MKQKGFTLIEILVVVTIIGVLAGLVVVLIPKGQFEAAKTDCINNVRNIAGLIETAGGQKYPSHSGANLILYLVFKGELKGEDSLKLLFCPGDPDEDLVKAGGEQAYRDIDLNRREYGKLTSYAGRDQSNPQCTAIKGNQNQVLLCDDSEVNHGNKGIVVGLSGGAAKWRDKVDDYKLRHDAPLAIGEGSDQEELRCLKDE